MLQKNRITALYERLSKDDDLQGESNSIQNQRIFLENYAKKYGFQNIQHFVDDGYTGKNFKRPGFTQMLKEVESGTVGTVIVKDMSRFGRNYLEVGFYTEILFPQKGVRFIAINNSIDSDHPTDNDFTPFLNIMNEWYVKDTSNKIRAIFESKMSEGKRCSGSIPYGYNRVPGDKQTLVVDPVASKVVKRIFELAAQRKGTTEIAKILTEDNVLIPSAYTLRYHPEQCNRRAQPGCCTWRNTTVGQILNRQEYLGHTVLRKTVSTSFKMDKRRKATEDEMLIFYNTHEPIISQELWDTVHRVRKRHPHLPYGTHRNASRYSGLVYCAGCGKRIRTTVHTCKNGEQRCNFYCVNHRSNQNDGNTYYISEKSLDTIMLHGIQRIARRIISDEKAFAQELQAQWARENGERAKRSKEELTKVKIRLDELDQLLTGLYENYVAGKLPERQYISMMNRYDDEQKELENRLQELQTNGKETMSLPLRIDKFIKLIKKYKEPTELTYDMIQDLVDRIVVHAAEGSGDNRKVSIEIYYRFIGQFDLAYTEEELLEIEQQRVQKEAENVARKKESQKLRSLKHQEKRKAEWWAENEGHKYPKRLCLQCQKEFWPNSNNHLYCSGECKKAHEADVRKAKKLENTEDRRLRERICAYCGLSYQPKTGTQKFCSRECLAEHKREMARNYYHNVIKKARASKPAEESISGELLVPS